jgi:hypothetical protein
MVNLAVMKNWIVNVMMSQHNKINFVILFYILMHVKKNLKRIALSCTSINSCNSIIYQIKRNKKIP